MNPLQEFKARILDNLATIGHLTREAVEQIEAEIRQEWGGDRYYLGRVGESDRMAAERSARNAAILRDWRNGERIELLMRRYRLSRSTIYAILDRRNDPEIACEKVRATCPNE